MVFASGVPWPEPDDHEHDHEEGVDHTPRPWPPDDAARTPRGRCAAPRAVGAEPAAAASTTAEMHDGVHERRRRAM